MSKQAKDFRRRATENLDMFGSDFTRHQEHTAHAEHEGVTETTEEFDWQEYQTELLTPDN